MRPHGGDTRMDIISFVKDLLIHGWGGAAQLVNIILALVGSGSFLLFLQEVAKVTSEPLTYASAFSLFLILTEWIPTLMDIVQAHLLGQSTKVASGDSVGEAMRMPWSRKEY